MNFSLFRMDKTADNYSWVPPGLSQPRLVKHLLARLGYTFQGSFVNISGGFRQFPNLSHPTLEASGEANSTIHYSLLKYSSVMIVAEKFEAKNNSLCAISNNDSSNINKDDNIL